MSTQPCFQTAPKGPLFRGAVCEKAYTVMRAPTRILFAFGGRSGGFFEADSVNKVVEIVDNALVEAVELRSFIGLEVDIAFDRAEDAGGKGSVDPLEQFEEDQTDRVSAWEQLIAPRAG